MLYGREVLGTRYDLLTHRWEVRLEGDEHVFLTEDMLEHHESVERLIRYKAASSRPAQDWAYATSIYTNTLRAKETQADRPARRTSAIRKYGCGGYST